MSIDTARFDSRARGLFIATLAATGNVSAAARAAGISYTTAHAHRATDPVFAKEWTEAIDVFHEEFEGAAAWRALHGQRRALWYKGLPVLWPEGHPEAGTQAYEIVYPDSLVPVLLKAQRPERHRDRSSVEMLAKVDDVEASKMAEELNRLAEVLAKRTEGEGPDGVRTIEFKMVDPDEVC